MSGFTPPPSPPPATVPIPSRLTDNQVVFDEKTDAYLNWQDKLRNWLASHITWLGTFIDEVGVAWGQIADAVSAAQNAAVAAATAKEAAIGAANFKGLWPGMAGALAKPACVKHKGRFWLLLNNLANVAASEPGVSADWTSLDSGNVMQEVAVSTVMVPGVKYVVKNAGITLTAPAGLLVGDPLRAYDASGGGFLADWNGYPVKGDVQTVPMSIPRYRGFDVSYSGSTLA